MSQPVLVLLAQGCEELEAVTIIDILRRANVDVVSAGLDGQPVTGSRGTKLIPDSSLDMVLSRDFRMVVLPGGLPGADNLANDARVLSLLGSMARGGKFTCAICAAPVVLAKAGVLAGKKATSYPGCLDNLGLPDVAYTGRAVEKDGLVITGRSPGTAMDFALALVEALEGVETRQRVEKALVRD